MNDFTHDNSALRICVDSVSDYAVSGRVFSCRLVEPIEFTDLSSLFLRLEKLFDRQKFPLAFQRTRMIVRDTLLQDAVPAADACCGMSEEMVSAQHGAVATFDLRVISRRNATWQGSVHWLDGSARQEFSGSLALLRMITAKLAGPDKKF